MALPSGFSRQKWLVDRGRPSLRQLQEMRAVRSCSSLALPIWQGAIVDRSKFDPKESVTRVAPLVTEKLIFGGATHPLARQGT